MATMCFKLGCTGVGIPKEEFLKEQNKVHKFAHPYAMKPQGQAALDLGLSQPKKIKVCNLCHK
jgi:hypothetical protein